MAGQVLEDAAGEVCEKRKKTRIFRTAPIFVQPMDSGPTPHVYYICVIM